MIEIRCRVKKNNKVIGYIVRQYKSNNDFYVTLEEINVYKVCNATKLRSGIWKAKPGYNIKTVGIDEIKGIDISSRSTSSIGKPSLIYNSSFGKLSLKQRKLLEKFKHSQIIELIKRDENISINMKDLSALTAYTNLEYSLFERNDKQIIMQGTKTGMHVTKNQAIKLLNDKYKWVGHTHPGNSRNCLMPSEQDYDTLKFFNQNQSMIYNSVGQYYVFGFGKE